MSHRSARTSAAAVVFALVVGFLASGCATVFGSGPTRSREAAIRACVETVPAEAVPYADAFAACMEGYGWVHRSTPPDTASSD